MLNILKVGKLNISRNGSVRGNYGKVFHGRYKDFVDVSIVQVDKSDIKVDADLLEKVDLNHLHPNIVRFYGMEDDGLQFK